MARDNSPKERQRRHLERKSNRRTAHDRILIVSEGSKTEPNYFNEIRRMYRLRTASVQVRPSELGTAPIQVVQYARQLFESGDAHKGIQPRSFERVYAVFDRDDHESYHDALTLADSLNGKLRSDIRRTIHFQAIASVPCFELWLLLHFEEVQSPLHRNDVMRSLKRHLPGYKKGDSLAFEQTNHLLDTATERAQHLAKSFNARTDPSPFTAIPELVSLLTGLQKK